MAPLQNAVAGFFAQARMPQEGLVLDAGCGTGIFGVVLRARRRLDTPELIGCDIFSSYLKAIPKGIYDDLVCCDIASLPFRDKVFNGVAPVEVIEHLDKPKGLNALREFERTARDVIVLTTPKGYYAKQCEDGNPFQTHLSSWSADEFRKLGFKVRFLPDIGSKLWLFMPFIVTYLTGIRAKTMICIKTLQRIKL